MLTKNDKDNIKIVNCATKVEELLANIGATGIGLNIRLNSVQHKLHKATVYKIRRLAGIRNKVVHHHKFKVKDINDFLTTCDQTLETLEGYIENQSTKTKSKNKKSNKAPELNKSEDVNDFADTQRLQKKSQSTKRKSKNKKFNKAPELNKSEDEDSSLFGGVLVILILVIIVWFLFGGADAPELQSDIESRQNKISMLRDSKKTLNVKIQKIDRKIVTEVRKQGIIRSIFNDTENVDNLENYQDELREDMVKIDKDIEVLNEEINELRIELFKIQ